MSTAKSFSITVNSFKEIPKSYCGRFLFPEAMLRNLQSVLSYIFINSSFN